MIVLDIETTGTDARKNCMVSLGAVDYETGIEFYNECSIYLDSEVHPKAMEINGFSLDEIQCGKKQSAFSLYRKFVEWARPLPDKLLAGQNVGHLDIPFLEELHARCPEISGEWVFGYRSVDLHSVAYAVFGVSLNHRDICERLGMPGEPKPHNALTGARSERDAFRKLFDIQKALTKSS